MTRVKICGVTNITDAVACVEAGAHAIGLIFYEASPRNVAIPVAAQICRELPPFVSRVGVFVNATEEIVRMTIEAVSVDTLQFHGEEPPDFCRRFGLKVIKAFRMKDRESLKELAAYKEEAWLLDSFAPNAYGGAGISFDWQWAHAAKELGRPIILAGGLTPQTVGQAIREVAPYGVDVSSGVEQSPGRKSLEKVRAFVKAAREADGPG